MKCRTACLSVVITDNGSEFTSRSLDSWAHARRRMPQCTLVLGGPQLDPMAVVGSAASFTFGLPSSLKLGEIGLIALLAAGPTLVLGARRSPAGQRRRLWALYLTSGLVSPAVLEGVIPHGLTYERYFAVSLAMLLLLVAAAVTRVAGELAVALLLALFVAGNVPAAARLIHEGGATIEGRSPPWQEKTTDLW